MNDNFIFTVLNASTAKKYYKDYLNLIAQLSTSWDKMTLEEFTQICTARAAVGYNTVLLCPKNNMKKIVATGSIFIEPKFSHFVRGQPGKVGHIEDIVVDSFYRGQGLGKKVIDELCRLANQVHCYKIILDCSYANVGFYEKCGFKTHEISMRKNIDENK
jgi:glucosamine-phosphate N-acetyltransferase